MERLMNDQPAPTTVVDPDQPTTEDAAAPAVEDVLVEEVSIDGMCGVY
jgi:mycofactocin precursor